MNLENCKVLSTADFGSTFQGLDDKYSDVDKFSVVAQPLEMSIFSNIKDGTRHVGSHHYYALERFVSLIMQGSFDSFLLLSSQLQNCRYAPVNQHVLDDFYKDKDVFHQLVMSRQKRYASSLMSVMKRCLYEQDKSPEKYGKTIVKKVAFMNRLYAFISTLEKVEKFDYKTFVKPDVHLTMLHVDDVLPYKRYTYKQWFNDDRAVGLYYKIEKDFRKLEKMYHSIKLKDSTFKKEDRLRNKTIKFLISKEKEAFK